MHGLNGSPWPGKKIMIKFTDTTFTRSAMYRIRIQGHISDDMTDYLGGMVITRAFTAGEEQLSILVGKLSDQAALAGVLNELYELHMPLLTVEKIEK